MAKKENAGTEAYRPDPNRETILMADKANGRLDVISEFRRDPNDNNRISVVTVTPETKNRASYYTLMFGSDAAKAISDLRYQDFVTHRDNPETPAVEREFFLCPVERVPEVVNAYYALHNDPKDEISAAILAECRTSSNQLDRLRYNLYDIPWGELASIGIDRNQLSAQDIQRLREGGETPALFDVVYKVGQDTQISADKCSLQMYRDLDDRPRLDVKGPLPHPEYKDEKYKMHISADDEARIAYGRALPRAIMVDNHGKQEWCYAGFRTDTNRMITVPVRRQTRVHLRQPDQSDPAERTGAGPRYPARTLQAQGQGQRVQLRVPVRRHADGFRADQSQLCQAVHSAPDRRAVDRTADRSVEALRGDRRPQRQILYRPQPFDHGNRSLDQCALLLPHQPFSGAE